MPEKLDHVIAGALWDFMGFLTTRGGTLTLGASHEASPAVEVVGEFLKLRGVDQECVPMIQHWSDRCSRLNDPMPPA